MGGYVVEVGILGEEEKLVIGQMVIGNGGGGGDGLPLCRSGS